MTERLWVCSVCGQVDRWSSTWRWWGALEERPTIAVCSDECRRAAETTLALPKGPYIS